MINLTQQDARRRALRTLGQGLAADVIAATTLFGAQATDNMAPRDAATLFAVLLAKTVTTSLMSYAGRFVSPPVTGDHVA